MVRVCLVGVYDIGILHVGDVLVILLSTFNFLFVVAFKTEKAVGIIATQFRLPCKRNKRKYREVKLFRP